VEKLNPGFVERRAALLPEGVIVVSGTNGKTTTASMIQAILKREGMAIVANRTGSNLYAGVASALLSASPDARIGVFEIDEGALPKLVPLLRVGVENSVREPDLHVWSGRSPTAMVPVSAFKDSRPDADLSMARSGWSRISRALGREASSRAGIAPRRTVARDEIANLQVAGLIGVFDPHRPCDPESSRDR
jgi:hypothetical protein